MAQALRTRHRWYYQTTPPKDVDLRLWQADAVRTQLHIASRRAEKRLRQAHTRGRPHQPEWGREVERQITEHVWMAVKLWEADQAIAALRSRPRWNHRRVLRPA